MILPEYMLQQSFMEEEADGTMKKQKMAVIDITI